MYDTKASTKQSCWQSKKREEKKQTLLVTSFGSHLLLLQINMCRSSRSVDGAKF